MFTQYLEKHDIRALVGGQPECPFARMGEREKWDAVQPQEREAIEALWRELHAKPYPMVLATDFLAFVRNGSRTQFEDPYFFRRTKLVASVLHMCVTGTADALDDVINGIWCILEESSWVISAHNVNPHPLAPPAYKKPLPDPDDGYIDLFAAQTAGILAAASHMLRGELDAVAPVIRRRISREIERRIFAPFVTRDDMWWMGFIRKDLCNWTPWIVSNVLLSASLEMGDRVRLAELMERAAPMIDRWLDVMPEDGGCDEGTAYYNVAGGALLDCLEILERETHGAMAFWDVPKVRNILSFPLHTHIAGDVFVNFADCDARPSLAGERIQSAGEHLSVPELTALGAGARRTAAAQVTGDIPNLARAALHLLHPAGGVDCAGEERDAWLPDLQLRMVRRGGVVLACKGGHNGESHNHNDVGTFILCVDGEAQVADMGNVTYTAKTFGPERYTIFNTRSMNHNLPLTGGIEQAAGREHAAKDVQYMENGLRLDIAAAYPESAGVRSLVRTMTASEGGAAICDEIELNEERPVSWVFMMTHEPVTENGTVRAGRVTLAYDADMTVSVTRMPADDPRLARNYPDGFWRVEIAAAPGRTHKRTFTMARS